MLQSFSYSRLNYSISSSVEVTGPYKTVFLYWCNNFDLPIVETVASGLTLYGDKIQIYLTDIEFVEINKSEAEIEIFLVQSKVSTHFFCYRLGEPIDLIDYVKKMKVIIANM